MSRRTLDSALSELMRRRLGQAGPWPAQAYRLIMREAAAEGVEPLEWLEQVERRPKHFSALIAAVTVGHTAFFRHPEQFEQLKRSFLPRMRARPVVRVWSAGCSTGEEVWSLALCLHEARIPFEIFASDANPRAIEVAQRASYSVRETRGLSEAREGSWCAPEALRRQVKFAVCSLKDELPLQAPSRFDLVFCRNLLIYLEPQALSSSWRLFLQRVEPWGAVVVAPVEALIQVPSELECRGPLGWFEVRKVETRTFPLPAAHASPPTREMPGLPEPAPSDAAERLLDRAARYLARGDLEQAESVLHEALNLRDDALGWFLLAEACIRRGEATQATVAYERAARATHCSPQVELDTIRGAALRSSRRLRESR